MIANVAGSGIASVADGSTPEASKPGPAQGAQRSGGKPPREPGGAAQPGQREGGVRRATAWMHCEMCRPINDAVGWQHGVCNDLADDRDRGHQDAASSIMATLFMASGSLATTVGSCVHVAEDDGSGVSWSSGRRTCRTVTPG